MTRKNSILLYFSYSLTNNSFNQKNIERTQKTQNKQNNEKTSPYLQYTIKNQSGFANKCYRNERK
jgi:hypothetical protein